MTLKQYRYRAFYPDDATTKRLRKLWKQAREGMGNNKYHRMKFGRLKEMPTDTVLWIEYGTYKLPFNSYKAAEEYLTRKMSATREAR